MRKTKSGQLAKVGLVSALATTLAFSPKPSIETPALQEVDPIEEMYKDWDNSHTIHAQDTKPVAI